MYKFFNMMAAVGRASPPVEVTSRETWHKLVYF